MPPKLGIQREAVLEAYGKLLDEQEEQLREDSRASDLEQLEKARAELFLESPQ